MHSYLTQTIKRAAQTNPRGIATIDGERRRSWAEVRDRVARGAGVLRSCGLSEGGRVGLLALNSDRYFELQFAVPWAGGVMVPLNNRLAPAEIAFLIEDAGVELLCVDAALMPVLDALGDAGGRIKAVISLADTDDGRHPHYETLIAGTMPAADAEYGGDLLAGIFYTGGNTGRPKGVMLSHNNLVTNALNTLAVVGYDEASVYLHAGPMFHLADGMAIYSVTMLGGTHVFIPKFDATQCLDIMAHCRVTHIALVPTMVELLVRTAETGHYDLSALRQIQFGASPMPDATLERLVRLWPDILLLHGWGMTELSPVGTMLPMPWRRPLVAGDRLKSCGKTALHMELRIVDPDGHELPPGEIGEIVARGPSVMMGYWNRPEETRAALRDGWLHTGDAAWIDDEGFVYIVDRLKDMIITGGENVYSTEVENVISKIPGVDAVAVIGLPDPTWGETVHAIVVARPDAALDAETIITECRKSIAGYKCPRGVSFRGEPLPITGAGKVFKRQLREEYGAGK